MSVHMGRNVGIIISIMRQTWQGASQCELFCGLTWILNKLFWTHQPARQPARQHAQKILKYVILIRRNIMSHIRNEKDERQKKEDSRLKKDIVHWLALIRSSSSPHNSHVPHANRASVWFSKNNTIYIFMFYYDFQRVSDLVCTNERKVMLLYRLNRYLTFRSVTCTVRRHGMRYTVHT